MDFTGKVALVTGGGNGMGRATSAAFARQGAKVVVDRDGAGAEATAGIIRQNGGDGLIAQVAARECRVRSTPIPGTNPQQAFTGNTFEYHSDLKGIGCHSEQRVRNFIVKIDRNTGTIGSYDGPGIGDKSTPPPVVRAMADAIRARALPCFPARRTCRLSKCRRMSRGRSAGFCERCSVAPPREGSRNYRRGGRVPVPHPENAPTLRRGAAIR